MNELMSKLISDKDLAKYVASHKQEIKQFIEEKAERIVKQELRSAFRTEDPYYDRKEGFARKMVRLEVDRQIKEVMAHMSFPIDECALQDKLNKSVNSQLRKVKAHVEIEM